MIKIGAFGIKRKLNVRGTDVSPTTSEFVPSHTNNNVWLINSNIESKIDVTDVGDKVAKMHHIEHGIGISPSKNLFHVWGVPLVTAADCAT